MAKATLSTQGYIYFVLAREVGKLKIGFTVNLEQRMRELQNSSPCKLELLRWVKGNYQTELALHAVFHELRVDGEWFIASDVLITFVKGLSSGQKFSSSQIALAK